MGVRVWVGGGAMTGSTKLVTLCLTLCLCRQFDFLCEQWVVFAIYDSVTPVELIRLILLINQLAPNEAVHVYKYEYIMKIR